MQPINFKGQNTILKPAPGTEHYVNALPIAKVSTTVADPNGNLQHIPIIYSCWELTDEEVDFIVKNRKIYAQFIGETHPPFSPVACDPFV